MSPTVLHVTQAVEAGVPHVVADQLTAGLAAGWRTVVASPGGSMARLAEEAGAEVVDWQARRAPDPARLRVEVRRLRGVVARVRPDVVVLHSAKAGLAGRVLLRGSLPTVFMPHAWSWQAARGAQQHGAIGWERWAARWTQVFACVGDAEAAEGRRRGLRGRFEVVPNQIDDERLRSLAPADRASARELVGVAHDERVAVCVARLAPQKDHRTLLRSWERVLARSPQARLYLVGDGPAEAEVRRLADRMLGVRLVGGVDRARALAWISAADVVVCSSRFEGRALVPQEAAALGRAVVTTAVAGSDEGYAGPGRVTVPVGDDAALGAATLRFVDDEAGARTAAERDLASTVPGLPAPERIVDLCAELVGRAR